MNIQIREARKKVNRIVSIAYFFLGVVIGNFAGITEAEITIPIISGLFAFIGGSAIAMVQKISLRDRVTTSLMILTICSGLLSGLYTGLWTRGVFPANNQSENISNPWIRSGNHQQSIDDFIDNQKKYNWDKKTVKLELENLLNDMCNAEK